MLIKQRLMRFIFSPYALKKSVTTRLALMGLATAVMYVANAFLEVKFLDVQFSLTIVLSCATGCVLGPLSGFTVCVLADFLGWLANSSGFIYMPWVGLSTGLNALLGGIFLGFDYAEFKGGKALKCALFILASFLGCTVAVNSTGFYFYNKAMGFSTAVVNYVAERFGGEGVSYFAYLVYRLIFKGQIYNSAVNYALVAIFYPWFTKASDSSFFKQIF